jgi:hypothetical protein
MQNMFLGFVGGDIPKYNLPIFMTEYWAPLVTINYMDLKKDMLMTLY